MRRVLVIGSGGSGKSTLARQLGTRTGLPVVHLDALYWQPGWVATADTEWHVVVAELLASDEWVMDGNYGGTLDLRLNRCDTVVFLDRSRIVCIARVLQRWLEYRGRSRPDMAPGCPERRPTWEFLNWIWTYPRRRRPQIVQRLASLPPGIAVHVLRSGDDIARFLASVPSAAQS